MDNKSLTNIDKLDGDNYQTWKLLMEMVLLHQDLWSVVDGSFKEPQVGEKDYAEWKRRANKAKALIILSLHTSQLELICKLELPAQI
jgi:hypothetical protein